MEAVFEQASMLYERDVMVRYANRTLQMLDAEHEGLVFGRLDDTTGEVLYVGRLGIRDADFENLVTDWRAPAAAAFYQATAEQPMDVVRRRVIRSSGQRVIEIDDDLLMPDEQPPGMRVIGEGALMATLNRARGDAMRDIVATIQKEQDEAIRAPWRGVTEITGGPGTGKTAVALHRVAYLLYRDRKRMGSAGVLVLGPSTAFTSYISRVLPSMGENSVELRSLGDLLDNIEATRIDPAQVAAIKGSLRMRRVLKKALRDTPPQAPTELRITYRGEVLKLDEHELAGVRRTVHALGRLPNRSRVDAAEALLEALWRKAESYEDFNVTRKDLLVDLGERIDFHRFVVVWWPVLSPNDMLRSLGDRSRLARAAGHTLSEKEIDLLSASWRMDDWSVADVALLDELRTLIGPPPKRRTRRAFDESSEPERRRPENYEDYSHIVVDESQDLSPMQWRMIARRGQYASWTLVGDPVQSTWPDPSEALQARDAALGKRTTHRRFTLRTNYRNSAEIFELAARVVRGVASDDELPRAVRVTGIKPTIEVVDSAAMPDAVRDAARELLDQVDGTVGVIGSMRSISKITGWVAGVDAERLRVVDAIEAKGLEYDAVVLVEPTEMVDESMTGPRALYVALTRATQRLAVVTTDSSWPSEPAALLRN
jgi:DNA helicase IV